MILQRRNRILRSNASIRSLIAETHLTPNDFIAPLFIDEGENIQTEIPSMTNYYRRSLDLTVKEVKELWSMGIKSVLLFIKCLMYDLGCLIYSFCFCCFIGSSKNCC